MDGKIKYRNLINHGILKHFFIYPFYGYFFEL